MIVLASKEDVTAWIKAYPKIVSQKVVRQYDTEEINNDYAIDVYSKSGLPTDLIVEVFVDNKKLKEGVDYSLYNPNDIRFINFPNDLSIDNKLVVKTQSKAKKNDLDIMNFPSITKQSQ